jgi:hypothetical protein
VQVLSHEPSARVPTTLAYAISIVIIIVGNVLLLEGVVSTSLLKI